MRTNLCDSQLDKANGCVQPNCLGVVRPHMQAQARQAGLQRVRLSPINEMLANTSAAISVDYRDRVEQHAPPGLQFEHGTNPVETIRSDGIVNLPVDHIGWKDVGDSYYPGCRGSHAAILVGERRVLHSNAPSDNVTGGYERDEVVQQEFIQAAPSLTDQVSDGIAFPSGRRPVCDLLFDTAGLAGDLIHRESANIVLAFAPEKPVSRWFISFA